MRLTTPPSAANFSPGRGNGSAPVSVTSRTASPAGSALVLLRFDIARLPPRRVVGPARNWLLYTRPTKKDALGVKRIDTAHDGRREEVVIEYRAPAARDGIVGHDRFLLLLLYDRAPVGRKIDVGPATAPISFDQTDQAAA